MRHVDPFEPELEDFAATTRGEYPPPRLGRGDALSQARALAALYESAAEGRRVILARGHAPADHASLGRFLRRIMTLPFLNQLR